MSSLAPRLWTVVAVLALGSSPLFAPPALAGGVFAEVPGGDPFKFCTEGMPSHGWKATNPATGSFKITGRRGRHNPQWIPVYQAICPAAAAANGGRGLEPVGPNTGRPVDPRDPADAAIQRAADPARAQ